MFTGVIFTIFLLCITIQLGYVLCLFGQVFRVDTNQATVSGTPQPVSVIICAKNEAHNLQQHLPAIMAQRYTNAPGNNIYEVIVVNDASTDETAAVLDAFQQQYAHLRVIHITPDEPRTLPGKKFALGKAVAQAQYEHLLLTDADCKPASDTWLAEMVAPLRTGKQLSAGYGKYETHGGLLNAFIRWETLHTFTQYSSYALAGIPYMAVGRNLACTKQAMQQAQQSEEWDKLPSGDDDLLVRSVGKGDNAGVVMSDTAFATSAPHTNWQGWLQQKQRHISTGKYYRDGTKLWLGIYAMSHALMWLFFFALLFTGQWQTALGLMTCRCVVYWLVWQHVATRLQEKGLVKWFPVLDIGWALYNFVLSPYIFWKNKQQWT